MPENAEAWLPWLLIAAVVLIVVGAIAAAIYIISRTLRRLGLGTLRTITKMAAQENAQTPRQLQNLTSTYAGLIKRDFPEFDAQEFLSMAENTLVLALHALESKHIPPDANFSPNLRTKIQGLIADINSKRETWFFDDIYIHKSCIAKYSSGAGTKIIRCEIALQYAHGVISGGTLVSGSRDIAQYKYTVDAVYVQDISKLSDGSMQGHKCPNCGAPVQELGTNKFCRYCGTGLREINVRIWAFDNYFRC